MFRFRNCIRNCFHCSKNIQSIRENCDIEFEKLFSNVEFIFEKFDISISLTRQNQRQSHSCNESP